MEKLSSKAFKLILGVVLLVFVTTVALGTVGVVLDNVVLLVVGAIGGLLSYILFMVLIYKKYKMPKK